MVLTKLSSIHATQLQRWGHDSTMLGVYHGVNWQTHKSCHHWIENRQEIQAIDYILTGSQGNIGITSLFIIPNITTAMISFAIAAEFRQQGFARMAVKETLKVAQKLGYKKVRAVVKLDNKRSHKLLLQAGFFPIAQPDNICTANGEHNNSMIHLVYELTLTRE